MTEPNAGLPDATADRRGRLLGVKLRALVSDHLDRAVDVDVQTLPSAAALILDGEGWLLIDGPARRGLGPALAWARRADCTELHLVADQDTGLLARRAGRLSYPVRVYFAEGRSLLPAVAEALEPPPAPRPDHLRFAPLIEAAGATVNVEHGVVTGEVRGLEVCRVVAEPTTGHVADLGDLSQFIEPTAPPRPADDVNGTPDTDIQGGSAVLLEVGVGAADREAFRLVHGDVPAADALRDVVESVRRRRGVEAHHPLNRMARERELRWRLQREPELAGLGSVSSAEPPLPRPSLRESVPCVAAATSLDGRELMLVCTTGVDLDLVGFVADVQTCDDRDVVVVLPSRDLVPITEELLGLLERSVEFRTVD